VGGGLSSLESLLALQDRVWLSTGELALHNEDCAVERGVDSMESLAVALAHQSQALAHSLRSLRDAQLTGVQGLLSQLTRSHADLVEVLRVTRSEESSLRERIDALNAAVDKHRSTVRMGAHLSLSSAKQAREVAQLEATRASRDATVKQLEAVVARRQLCQAQLLNLAALANECAHSSDASVSRRDYKAMYLQAQHALYRRSVGDAYQMQTLTLIKVLARLRDTAHECGRRKRFIEHTIHEVRARISLVVSAYWK
jgi:hypothetical protein